MRFLIIYCKFSHTRKMFSTLRNVIHKSALKIQNGMANNGSKEQCRKYYISKYVTLGLCHDS